MAGIGSFKSPEGAQRYFQAYEAAAALNPVPAEELDVSTSYGTTRVYRFGQDSGQPIVLLPGFLATATVWAPHIPALAERHPVYTLDTIGEPGRSVQTRPLADHAARAEWLDSVLDELDLTGVHLIGASTGGFYAVNQAIHAPARLASLSLLDPTTVTAPFAFGVLWRSVLAATLNQDWLWRRVMRWLNGADVVDSADIRLVLAGIREYKARLPLQIRPTEEEIRSIKLPVLAVFAEQSSVHNAPAAAERLRRLLPQAEVELWPGTGHYMQLTQLDRINQRLLEFLHQG